MRDNSIDTLSTDSPYGMGFLQHSWDQFTSMGFLRFTYKWSSIAFKKLKPGGYLLNFAIPKKYHLMACGIELAGFNIKDCILWCFGDGISHSLDISKAIDNYYGKEREVVGIRYRHGGGTKDQYMGMTQNPEVKITKPTTEEALLWSGYGTGLKSAVEFIIVAQKPYEKTYVNNILKYGVGGLNIDGCRINYSPEKEVDSRIYNPSKNITRGSHKNATIKYAPDGNEYPMYKTKKGRWPTNLILSHHPECKLLGIKKVKTSTLLKKHKVKYPRYDKFTSIHNKRILQQEYGKDGFDIVEKWHCHPDCPVRIIDQQSGISGGGTPKHNSEIKRKGLREDGPFNPSNCGFDVNKGQSWANYGDKGGASRFFYCAKVYPTERNAGCEDLFWKKHNNHLTQITEEKYHSLPEEQRAKGNPISTLKPINLMRYLVRLVTPPNGIVLDPFTGSGTTGIACLIEGFKYILIEEREPFAKIIIPHRLKHWKDPAHWNLLKDHNLLPKIKTLQNQKQNMSIMKFMEV